MCVKRVGEQDQTIESLHKEIRGLRSQLSGVSAVSQAGTSFNMGMAHSSHYHSMHDSDQIQSFYQMQSGNNFRHDHFP